VSPNGLARALDTAASSAKRPTALADPARTVVVVAAQAQTCEQIRSTHGDAMAGHDNAPELLPILARGHHRRPSKGACFMELASYLAGEKWSDHPQCTHPLMASLARSVNDCTSDAGRSRLAVLIPSVIGLTGDDLRIDATIALRAARTALPVVSADRQRVMAVAVLTCERVISVLDGRSAGDLDQSSRLVLADAPEAARWARQFSREISISPRGFRRHSAPSTVRTAVLAVADACVADPDLILHDMLAGAIHDVVDVLGRTVPAVEADTWADVCRLTGAR
jgi:hypothetical protein